MANGTGESGSNGAVESTPADLFENFSAGEAQLLDDAAPFRNRPTPIGGSRKGVPNKRTQQMRELYLKSGLPHPLLWQGSLLRLGIDGLAAQLDCTLIEAADLLAKVADRLAPYIEGKMPTKVEVNGANSLPVMILGDVSGAVEQLRQVRDEGAMGIDDDVGSAVQRYEQNQRIKDGATVRLSGDASHDEAK